MHSWCPGEEGNLFSFTSSAFHQTAFISAFLCSAFYAYSKTLVNLGVSREDLVCLCTCGL